MFGRWKNKRRIHEIAPDEIFLDSSNLPEYDSVQFEGRVVRPVSARAIFTVGIAFALVALGFGYWAFYLQIAHGDTYAKVSRDNTLDRSVIFSVRGLIYDRNGKELAWNQARVASSTGASSTFALRKYADAPGLSHVLGFVQYPKADQNGRWWREVYSGVSGLELSLDERLQGENGSRLVETDALGNIVRENIVVPPQEGEHISLSIDADVQSKLFSVLSAHAERMHFKGGAAVIMDVRTGAVLALTSFPEYDNQAFTNGETDTVRAASNDPRTPLLNRAVAGLYTPGSIVKPIFAIAAVNEGIISPDKKIESKGALILPNPFNPDQPSIFRDWTVHGWVNMREAIAVSSDEYFYTIGGGFGTQKGLGIIKMDEYAKKFGLAEPTGIDLGGEETGLIPTPEWKERMFGVNDPWRIGDTYHTVIGQFGFQITVLQAVRYIAAIANGGKLMKPQLVASSTPEYQEVGISDEYLQIARDGMRMAVESDLRTATVKALHIGGIKISAKTGTAQLGFRNESMNSWSIGFWPADDPKYAYAVVLEKAPAGTPSGAAPGLVPFFQWLMAEKPEYVK
ncbi:MAG TPA: penicillin-binding transpeptidase domain-containing protein [Candidatus Paceibacterota bacterium]